MKTSYSMKTPQQLKALLNDLVSVGSITLSEQEKFMPLRIHQHLMDIPYYQEHPELLQNHLTTDGRSFLTALYRHPLAKKTVVLISHFDVVDVEDFGDLKHLAFRPDELTAEWHRRKELLPEDARADLETDEWLFGRGTMDMKCGLVQHMSLLEKAAIEEWEINLLLLTVPDEEVNSVGMREAIPKINELAKQHHLAYTLFLNSEPMFSQKPGDNQYYFYTGSIGKIMPSALCFGKETHVGEPLSGVNAAWMSSMLSQEVEWNEKLCETSRTQTCPPPTILWQKDLKEEYSTQIPHRSVSMYNFFLMEKNPEDVMELMKGAAAEAVNKMEAFMADKYKRFGVDTRKAPSIRVLSYQELRSYACQKAGTDYIAGIEHFVAKKRVGDNRAQAIDVVDQISILCQELAPMIVLFFAPPYYPAVQTGNDPLIEELSQSLITFTKETYGHTLQSIDYFNGISDLSYALLQAPLSSMEAFDRNMPGERELYHIPFAEMAALKAPVLNIGPIGKDAHKKTERLYLPFAFEELPGILEYVIKKHQSQ
ncbi:M20/M25/M40 family metallo-hydrolase [Bacillus testis]|uniref:M20/M25/M40 family metallo-hydrolase n=1 Tax=Bacillus testis TaxID=1622072 RepID=UPI0009E21F57|nr:M20/M25/M40 family metallo-hydrolase [Bacillus testis]